MKEWTWKGSFDCNKWKISQIMAYFLYCAALFFYFSFFFLALSFNLSSVVFPQDFIHATSIVLQRLHTATEKTPLKFRHYYPLLFWFM